MFGTIAVGTDGSVTASEAVRVAADVARHYGAKLLLLSAYRESGEAPSDRNDETQWAFNPVARLRALLAQTEEELGADLLVIGNRGMRRRVLGSVPNTVTHRAPCAVLVVKTS